MKMVDYLRGIEDLVHLWLFQEKKKVIVVYGPRQVGKTTLLKKLEKEYANSYDPVYLNCDELYVRQSLTDRTSVELKQFIGHTKLLFIDEAQRVPNIGLVLKLLHDNYPEVQIVATGSSSFELANKIKEPLTGRKVELHMFPLSLGEIAISEQLSEVDIKRRLENRIIYGGYPEVVSSSKELTEKILKFITDSYLYKDLLSFQKIQKPEILERLLQVLALQIGSEVSFNELSGTLGVDKNTVENYVQLLEKAFIIFRLRPLHRNKRNELKKLRKIYFYDTGVRNALIRNFNPLELRQDKGALWENFIIVERLKRNSFVDFDPLTYFWQTHQKQEIDYLEESGGLLHGYEIKWKNKNIKVPKAFSASYPESTFEVIDREHFWEFIKWR